MFNEKRSSVECSIIKVEGDYEIVFELSWSDDMTEQMQKSWNDQREVTEYGATAIAALLLQKLTNYEILGRAKQEEGIDYYLGYDNNEAIQGFLEVSGIWKQAPENTVNIRVNKKIKRIKKLKDEFPVFVIVTEFGQPQSKIVSHG